MERGHINFTLHSYWFIYFARARCVALWPTYTSGPLWVEQHDAAPCAASEISGSKPLK